MSENKLPPGWVNANKINENYRRFPYEELAKYAGQYIAWNLDGDRILASGRTRDEVEEKLQAMGIHFSEWIMDYVDPPEITSWI